MGTKSLTSGQDQKRFLFPAKETKVCAKVPENP